MEINIITMQVRKIRLRKWLAHKRMAIVAHTCNPSTPKAGAGGFEAQGQPGLCRDPVSQRQHAA